MAWLPVWHLFAVVVRVVRVFVAGLCLCAPVPAHTVWPGERIGIQEVCEFGGGTASVAVRVEHR